jgi:hypothetical protein
VDGVGWLGEWVGGWVGGWVGVCVCLCVSVFVYQVAETSIADSCAHWNADQKEIPSIFFSCLWSCCERTAYCVSMRLCVSVRVFPLPLFCSSLVLVVV